MGIGANAAMFGIVDRMLFRPPPFMKSADSVHRLYFAFTARGKESIGGASYQFARYIDLATKTSSFAQMAAYSENDLAVGVGDAAREMRVGIVSASFFDFFNAPPVLGRYFTTAEDQPPSGSPVAVMSAPMWRTQYGERRDVLGTKVQIGSIIYTIVGVTPPGFVGLWPNQAPAFYLPVTTIGASTSATMTMRSSWWKTYQWGWLGVIARRKPGVSLDAANADLMHAVQDSYATELAENPRGTPARLARPRAFASSILSERGPKESRVAKVATWVGGVAVIVLLIACANVGNLLLARSMRRRREIAIRLALGVSRGRLFRLLLIDSVLLSAFGGIAGILVGHWGGAVLRAGLIPNSTAPGVMQDTRTLVFAAAVALFVGVLTGIAPIVDAGRVSLTGNLRSGVREGTFRRSRLRASLLVTQAAMSVLLLIGAGLFVRSLRNVQSLRLGYDADRIALVELNMRGVRLAAPQTAELRSRLLARVRFLPGVENATLQLTVPFWNTFSTRLFVEGIDTVAKLGRFDLNAVSPEYFATMGTHLVRGRGFTSVDGPLAPRVMVVSESMALKLWPGREAIGQCVRVNSDTMPCTSVVGIAEDIKAQSLSEDPSLFYYLPAPQFPAPGGGLFVRTRLDATTLIETLRQALQREMPGVAYVAVTPFSSIVGRETQSWKLGATMFVVFGLLALAVASVGLYSVVAYTVMQRTHELGVRVALGAQSSDVLRLVLGQGIRLGGAGIGLGIVLASAAANRVQPLLFHESPRDPYVFAIVAVVLFAVTVAASCIPGRRAARVDPSVALRVD
jgi:predicted permease